MKLTPESSIFLDLVRGSAAQMVLFGHAISYFGVLKSLHEPSFPWIQNIGVVVFFILSGFIITHTVTINLESDPKYNFSYYFVDRFSRIFPAYVSALILVATIDSISSWIDASKYRYHGAFNLNTLLANLVMLQDFPHWYYLFDLPKTSFGSARPLWTIAIEWWIYMFFGFLWLIASKKPTLINLCIACMASVVPVFNLTGGRGNGLTMYWMLGSVAYVLASDGRIFPKEPRTRALIPLCALLVSLLGIKTVNPTAYDPIFAFCLTIALAYGVACFSNFQFSSRISHLIKANASFSFTLYLIHYSVLDFVSVHAVATDPYVLLVASIVLCNLISYVVAQATEVRLTKLVRSGLRQILDRRSCKFN